jgi:hypothetical protein
MIFQGRPGDPAFAFEEEKHAKCEKESLKKADQFPAYFQVEKFKSKDIRADALQKRGEGGD